MSEQPRFCYWSVADGFYSHLMSACIASARATGVTQDFHVWTDKPIPGATCHPCGKYEHKNYLFKFDFLLKAVELPYDYFIFLDADNYFVRHPGDILRLVREAPVHVLLESDCTHPTNTRPDWWGCPLQEYARLMRLQGVQSRSIFNTNAGFWIVHRDVARRAVELGLEFWHAAHTAGYSFTEEAPLAYVGHMLMGNPYTHTLEENVDAWASDWTGVFADRLPSDREWMFTDYLAGHQTRVRPAIVHCMRSKQAMYEQTQKNRHDSL
ncbi:hypothetical protein [Aureliella helgolandensis]|uniref:Nucleotide-diphospho-sugar transferase domain-containing protein n=1 Tax=Aureliella helgolandensis TaxID=2527968 RepID=A0A518GA17_9BACT|nr:hypothetical protein [Aureliella helgolandensis]QDV25413.1 hypothetical protein Q31a_37390 [Aureliella helgolandensis]